MCPRSSTVSVTATAGPSSTAPDPPAREQYQTTAPSSSGSSGPLAQPGHQGDEPAEERDGGREHHPVREVPAEQHGEEQERGTAEHGGPREPGDRGSACGSGGGGGGT